MKVNVIPFFPLYSKFYPSFFGMKWHFIKVRDMGEEYYSYSTVLFHVRCSIFVRVLHQITTDIAHRLEMVRIMLERLQCNVFMLSYRGYVYLVFT